MPVLGYIIVVDLIIATDPNNLSVRLQVLEGDDEALDDKEELIFKHLLGMAGLHFSRLSGTPLANGTASSGGGSAGGSPLSLIESTTLQMQSMLQDKLSEDDDMLTSFLAGMESYLQVSV